MVDLLVVEQAIRVVYEVACRADVTFGLIELGIVKCRHRLDYSQAKIQYPTSGWNRDLEWNGGK